MDRPQLSRVSPRLLVERGFSIRAILQYPLSLRETKIRLGFMIGIALIPFLGSFLVGHFAAAAVSVVTIEGDETSTLPSDFLISRFVRALMAGFVSFLYIIPVVIGFGIIGISIFKGENVTLPAVLFSFYLLLVGAVWPLAVLHAVSTENAWQALHLPKLLWIGLKIDLLSTLKILGISAGLFILKIVAWGMSGVGLWFVLAPVEAYSEYAFQYALAKAYRNVLFTPRSQR